MTHEEKAKLLAGQKWDEIRVTLVMYALKRTKNRAWASDLAQEAILRIHDTKRQPWDPAVYPDLKLFLIGMVRQMLSDEWSSARRHRELQMDLEERDEDDGWRKQSKVPEDKGPNPEEAVGTRRLLNRRLALLRARLADDPGGLVVHGLMERSIEKPEDQKVESGLSDAELANARKRYFRAAEAVARDLPEGAYDDDASAGEALPSDSHGKPHALSADRDEEELQ